MQTLTLPSRRPLGLCVVPYAEAHISPQLVDGDPLHRAQRLGGGRGLWRVRGRGRAAGEELGDGAADVSPRAGPSDRRKSVSE